MKYLGLDFGEARIGLALSDKNHIIAEPLKILDRSNDIEAIKKILEVIEQNSVEKIVFGFPVTANDEQKNRYKIFAQKLEKKSGIKIEFYDESFSTKQAQNMLGFSSSAQSHPQTRNHRDDVAAAFVLQKFLDYENSRTKRK